ncbi:MAG: beta-L-arabinofuranosidase domain-containing protein [Planctomycetota bacterium]|nr:beta-L-arabinofuranosidase domain-containing protein [Planctomycetota bacterium]
MHKTSTTTAFLLLLSLLPAPRSTAADYPLTPIPFNEVTITSDFWRPRLVTQRKTLVPFAFERTQAGVKHLAAARDHLRGIRQKDHRPHRFIDSDLYKVMEGAAYLLQLERDPELEATLDRLATLISQAQHPNGYLYPSHTTGVGRERDMMGDRPYTFIVHSHELYNVGHMYEAAIAYYRATGKRTLLDVAEKSAQHINKVIFEGDPQYNGGHPILQAPGHQEMELALVRLYRVTGKQLYLDMARQFLEIRGKTYIPDGEGVMAPTYAQQHSPVLKQRQAVGHAVRATYQYSAMADVGILTGEPAYETALDHIWGDITDTRMHITGGLGAVHGIEGFGPQYELPNADAFNETCAAVGNVLFNYRMFLLTKQARYLDVAEISLLNNVLAAVNFEGNRFFYVNPLDADGKFPFNHGTAGRAPWFGTACCPSNLARLIPQVPGMTYAHDEDELYITFFAQSSTRLTLNGVDVQVRQETGYPNDGNVNIHVHPEEPSNFKLKLRIPTWTQRQFVPGELYRYADPVEYPIVLRVNGQRCDLNLSKGFATIQRTWQKGDHISLSLPMPLRASICHPSVQANVDRFCFTRGPFVLCAEGIDNGGSTQRFYFDRLPGGAHTNVYNTEIDYGTFLQLEVPGRSINSRGTSHKTRVQLTPYYAWNNRGTSSMTVWFPRRKDMAVYDPHALPKESVFTQLTASHTSDLDTVNAVGDGREPEWSSGNKVPRWTSRGQPGIPQWIEARFTETKQIRSIGVYWMQDQFDVKFPKEWSLEVQRNGEWQPFELYTTDRYDTRANQYNVVHPASPLKCDALRIRVIPQQEAAVGILEIQAIFEE